MRTTVEALSVRVVVRRVRGSAAPYVWEVYRTNAMGPIHVSRDRFRSMEAAYQAGQARLSEFIPRRLMPSEITDAYVQESHAMDFSDV